jgi:hypothetical protein
VITTYPKEFIALTDAMEMFDAIDMMNPPLPGDYPDLLKGKKAAIVANHNNGGRGMP